MTALLLLALAAGPSTAQPERLPPGAVMRLGKSLSPLWEYAALSSSGRWLAARLDGDLFTIDVLSGRKELVWKDDGGLDDAWDQLAISPDGKYVLGFAGGTVKVLNASKRKPEAPLHEARGGPYVPVCFSANGRVAVGAMGERMATVRVWQLDRRKELCRVDLPGRWAAVALSPDGNSLACWLYAPPGKQLFVHDVATGKRTHTIDSGTVLEAAFSNDGKSLAFLGPQGDKAQVCVWSLAERKSRRRALLPTDYYLAPCFSPDGSKLAMGGLKGAVRVLDIPTGKLEPFRSPRGVALVGLAYRVDGQLVAAGWKGDGPATWPLRPTQAGVTQGHALPVRELAFSRDGKLLFSAANDGARVWDVRAGREWRYLPHRGWELAPHGARGTLFFPDGKDMLILQMQHGLNRTETTTTLFDMRTGKTRAAPWAEGQCPGELAPLTYSAGRRRVLVGRDQKGWHTPITYWDLEAQRVLAVLTSPILPFKAALSPDESHVFLWGHRPKGTGGTAGLLARMSDGKLVRRAQLGEGEGMIDTVCWSPDGRTVATLTSTLLHLFDTRTGLAHTARFPVSDHIEARFSHDGRLLALLAAGGQVTVYEMATATPRLKPPVGANGVGAVAFSPECLLATGGNDTSIVLWDTSGRKWPCPPGRPSAADWAALASDDAARAWPSMVRLAHHPAEAVALLRKHLRPARATKLSEVDVRRLVDGFGSDNFATRLRSQEALSDAAPRISHRLEQALRETDDLEVKMRLRAALRHATFWPCPREARSVRAVEVLERLATPEARKFLRELSAGDPDSRLTHEAKAALARLEESP